MRGATPQQQTWNEDNVKFAGYHTLVFGVLMAIALVVMGVAFVVQHNHRYHAVNAEQHAIASNNMWLSVAGKDHAPLDPVVQLFANDIKPFVQSTVIHVDPDTRFAPHDVTGLEFPNYPDLHNKIGWEPFVQNPRASIRDSGHLTGEVLADLAKIHDGQVQSLIVPIPHSPIMDKYTLTPGGVPVWWCLLAAWMVFGPLSMLMVLLGGEDPFRWQGELIIAKAWTMFLALPIFLPRNILYSPWIFHNHHVQAKTVKEQRRTELRRIEAEKVEAEERRLNNPVYAELLQARQDLNTLMTLPLTNKQIKQAITDTKELINELETFPDQLSVRASELVAKRVVRRNADRRMRPKALLEAQDEVDGIQGVYGPDV